MSRRLFPYDSSTEESDRESSQEMEMKVLGYVQPYSEESVVHTSDDEDTAEDEDGLFSCRSAKQI